MSGANEIKIIRIPVPSPTLWPHVTTNCYLIGNRNSCILIDAGYNQPETKEVIESVLREHNLASPEKIVLTHHHHDHALGVEQLKDWNAHIYCHQDEYAAITKLLPQIKNLHTLGEDDLIIVDTLEIQVIHAPGHTAGQMNFYIPTEEILIEGDNILGKGTTWIGAPDGDMSDYFQTLNRLKKLQLKRIGPGHGDWVKDPYEQINFVLERRLAREKQIISLLTEQGELTSEELTKMIYDNNIHPSIFEVAKRTIEAHLIKLMKEQTVMMRDFIYYIL